MMILLKYINSSDKNDILLGFSLMNNSEMSFDEKSKFLEENHWYYVNHTSRRPDDLCSFFTIKSNIFIPLTAFRFRPENMGTNKDNFQTIIFDDEKI